MDLDISIRLIDFFLLEKRLFVIQFNEEIVSMMLSNKFV